MKQKNRRALEYKLIKSQTIKDEHLSSYDHPVQNIVHSINQYKVYDLAYNYFSQHLLHTLEVVISLKKEFESATTITTKIIQPLFDQLELNLSSLARAASRKSELAEGLYASQITLQLSNLAQHFLKNSDKIAFDLAKIIRMSTRLICQVHENLENIDDRNYHIYTLLKLYEKVIQYYIGIDQCHIAEAFLLKAKLACETVPKRRKDIYFKVSMVNFHNGIIIDINRGSLQSAVNKFKNYADSFHKNKTLHCNEHVMEQTVHLFKYFAKLLSDALLLATELYSQNSTTHANEILSLVRKLDLQQVEKIIECAQRIFIDIGRSNIYINQKHIKHLREKVSEHQKQIFTLLMAQAVKLTSRYNGFSLSFDSETLMFTIFSTQDFSQKAEEILDKLRLMHSQKTAWQLYCFCTKVTLKSARLDVHYSSKNSFNKLLSGIESILELPPILDKPKTEKLETTPTTKDQSAKKIRQQSVASPRIEFSHEINYSRNRKRIPASKNWGKSTRSALKINQPKINLAKLAERPNTNMAFDDNLFYRVDDQNSTIVALSNPHIEEGIYYAYIDNTAFSNETYEHFNRLLLRGNIVCGKNTKNGKNRSGVKFFKRHGNKSLKLKIAGQNEFMSGQIVRKKVVVLDGVPSTRYLICFNCLHTHKDEQRQQIGLTS